MTQDVATINRRVSVSWQIEFITERHHRRKGRNLFLVSRTIENLIARGLAERPSLRRRTLRFNLIQPVQSNVEQDQRALRSRPMRLFAIL